MTATAYRLTPTDEVRVADAIARAIVTGFRDRATLIRLGAHAIGCGIYDLRDVELTWIETTADTALHPEETTP